MKILVTGGAGYIGSFMVKTLLDRGDEVVVIDSLEKGHTENLDTRAIFLQGNILDAEFIDGAFTNHKFDAVIHFAAYISMAESMEKPEIYFHNNVFVTLNLLEAMLKHGVNKIIFSSTAGVYGNPQVVPIPENHPKNPENPYGESKWMVERLLYWFAKQRGISSVALRYFNAAGAALDGSMGEAHDPETHLIPNVMKAALSGSSFKLFGDDYKTKDGSCVRDYVHVLDLAQAHLCALQKLTTDQGYFDYNVGTGNGYSNKEVVTMVKEVSGKDFPVEIHPRRPGDANELIADCSKIKTELGFSPKYSDLKNIIESAWKWHSKQKDS